jgi:hypothetical protein
VRNRKFTASITCLTESDILERRRNSRELFMRRFLIILEGATIGIVVAYGVVGLWRDWKISQSPEAVVEQFELHPVSPPKGLGI